MLPRSFYLRPDVVEIARDLLGKLLVTRFDGNLTSGFITETEAYTGVTDRASHAFGGRRTARTEVMYRIGGTAYIYLCYGVHSLFNVVTNQANIPHAILIRGIQPEDGFGLMQKRLGKTGTQNTIMDGPGKVSKALGIHFSHTGLDLTRKPGNKTEPAIWIEEPGKQILPHEILVSTRIGVNYAGKDALLPYRFLKK
ncbi:MAG: DNA-3-methyladenine glycosylase [bacterium]